jgi:membrane-bound lytic murein transglycosylase D
VTPDNLKDNVAFWKKIYTEVALSEGLFHDRDYPMIIYRKVTIGKLRGRTRRRLLRKHSRSISHTLDNINRKPQSKWGIKEKYIAGLFKQYGAPGAVKTAKSRIRFQQGQKDRFKLGVERSGAYLDYIRKVFKEYDIPLRIAYLPHVESSFNIDAYSRVGAAGMWQFMRRTGRLYLKIDYRIDERRDPYKATVAAAKLLKQNYEQVKSWPLAITAYNHGLVSIKRAVRQTGTRDIGVIIEKYKNRRFRFASKNFYSCFLAASEIGADPRKYFPNLDYHKPLEYNEIVLDSYIKCSTLCKHLGLSKDEFMRLNPSLRPTILRRGMSIPRGFKLRIPAALTPEAARQKIAGIPGSLKSSKSTDFLYYSVRRGDTLYRIARRFRVSTSTLLAANNIRRKNRIYIGQVLRIPQRNSAPKKAVPVKPKPAKPSVEKSIPTAPENQQSPKPSPETSPETSPKTSPVEMKTAETQYNPANFDATLYNLDVTFFPKTGIAHIRAAMDETLAHYADWLETSYSRIRNLNRMRGRTLKVNQKIKLPADEKSLEQFKIKRLEYHMALEEDFYNRYRVTGVNVTRVKYGQTLWSICKRGSGEEEIPFWLFKKYNRHVDIDKIRRNTKIKVPIVKSK